MANGKNSQLNGEINEVLDRVKRIEKLADYTARRTKINGDLLSAVKRELIARARELAKLLRLLMKGRDAE